MQVYEKIFDADLTEQSICPEHLKENLGYVFLTHHPLEPSLVSHRSSQ